MQIRELTRRAEEPIASESKLDEPAVRRRFQRGLAFFLAAVTVNAGGFEGLMSCDPFLRAAATVMAQDAPAAAKRQRTSEPVPAGKQDPETPQKDGWIRSALRAELYSIEKICKPTREQLEQITKDSEKCLEDAKQLYSKQNDQLTQAMLSGKPLEKLQYLGIHQLIRVGLVESLKKHVSAEQAARFQLELSKRYKASIQVLARNFVVLLDDELVLSAEQRDAITETLISRRENDWGDRPEMVLALNPGLPDIPDQFIVPHLDAGQRTVWNHGPKRRPFETNGQSEFARFMLKVMKESPAKKDANPPRNLESTLPDQILDGLFFRKGENAAAAKQRLEALLELHVAEAARTCSLSDGQRGDLESAVQMEIKRRLDDVEKRRKSYQSPPLNQGKLLTETQNQYDSRLFGDGSFFAKALKQKLAPDQFARYEKIDVQRRTFRFRARLELIVAEFDDLLSLHDAQHEQILRLLLEESQLPAQFARLPDDLNLVNFQAASVPATKFTPFLDERQQQLLKENFDRAKATGPRLKGPGQDRDGAADDGDN